MRDLAPGYSSEVNTASAEIWHRALVQFEDASIFQTWPYGVVTSGSRNLGHLILKENGNVVAMAQARVLKVPLVGWGIAYVRYGPLWRCRASGNNVEAFRQVLRALRNEFVHKRGLVLRVLPVLFDADPPCFAQILSEEGYSPVRHEAKSRTLLLDISPSTETLQAGLQSRWRRYLKAAQKQGLCLVEGTADDLFAQVIDLYRELVSRKRFAGSLDIEQFRTIQRQLPENLKMKILVASSDLGPCAALVWSAIGNTGIPLFAATGERGLTSHASYLLQWRLIERLKEDGLVEYDLGGINPLKNPGTYRFKSALAGTNSHKDVCSLGRFESHASPLVHAGVEGGYAARRVFRRLMAFQR